MAEDTILVVEDDKNISALVTDMLKFEGFKTLAADNVGVARELLKRGLPAMVILDRMLPDADGLELCMEIRRTPQWKGLPVLVLSALNSAADKMTGFEIGCDDYLAKPFSCGELVARVAALMRRVQQQGSKPESKQEKTTQNQSPVLLPEPEQQMAEQIRKASEQYEHQLEERKTAFLTQNEEHKASLKGLHEQLERWHKAFNTNQPELALRAAQSSGWSQFAKKIAIAVVPIALIAAIAAFWIYWRSGHDYVLPFSHPTGLVWQKDALWVSDWYDQAIYQLRQDGKNFSIIHRYALPKCHVDGLALAENKLYLIDSWSRQIQRWHIQEEQLTLEASWPSPGQTPSAIYFDGKDLWTSDKESRRIYRHTMDEKLTVLNTYPIEHSPVGFFADNENFWSADEHSGLVYRHRWDPALTIIATYGLTKRGQGKLACFTLRDGRVWLGWDGSNVLSERAWWRFERHGLQ